MDILFKKLFAQLLFWLMQLMDGIMDFFNILCGIKNVGTNKDGSGGTDIITYFLSQNGIVKAFFNNIRSVYACACCKHYCRYC